MASAEKRGNGEKRKWSRPKAATAALSKSPWAAARPRATAVWSATRDEIERFWRRKRMEEEDHLLAALKAAARARARTLKEEDYKQFEASLEGILNSSVGAGKNIGDDDENLENNGKAMRTVIRDWWTKSKYAYLNQPAVQSMEPEASPKGTPTFIPSSCFHAVVSPNPCSALGVF